MHKRPVNMMDNPNAERVKRVAQLAGRSAVRNKRQQFLAEGPQSTTEALRAHLGLLELSDATSTLWPVGQTVAEIYFTPQLEKTSPELFGLIQRIDSGVFVATTTNEVLQAMSDAVVHQNVLAVVNLPVVMHQPAPDAVLAAVMVRVQDPGNAGTIIRAADAAGADYVVATPETVDIYNPKVVRSTAGSLFHLPVYTGIPLESFIDTYTGQVYAADGYGAQVLDSIDHEALQRPTAWLMGNEARGLNQTELALADQRVAVPLYGLAESLNVATAATICLYSSAMAQRQTGDTN